MCNGLTNFKSKPFSNRVSHIDTLLVEMLSIAICFAFTDFKYVLIEHIETVVVEKSF
jgi:hypothetical protein